MDDRALCGNIKEREIILYGDMAEIADFINAYGSLLTIKWIITDHKKEMKLQAYAHLGIKTMMVEEVTFADELIVVCDKKRFITAVRRLEYLGRVAYKDYISKELVDVLLYEKALMVCMGTQLMGQVSMLLNNCSHVTDTYRVLYFEESNILEPYMNYLPECMHVCRLCDVYVRSSCEKQNFESKIIGSNILKAECKIITVADYGFGGYFPQIIRNRDLFSDFLLRERMRLDISYETFAFSRVDREMEKLCREKNDVEDIAQQIVDDNFYSAEYVKGYFAEEINRFKELEKDDDIKLGAFIEKHQDECLCRNLNEWNEPVISYVTEQLLQLLGLQGVSVTIDERQRLIEEHSGSEIPVYPSVKKAMGLEQKLQDKKYRVTTYFGVKYMELDEYVRYLVEYIQKAMELMCFMGTDDELRKRLGGK